MGEKAFSRLDFPVILFLALAGVLLGQALPAGAESANSLARKGNEYYSHKLYQEATDAYRQSLLRKPDAPLVQYNLGTALAQQGHHSEAEQALSQAAEAPGSPRRRDAYYNLGVSLSEAAKAPPAGKPAAAAPQSAAPPGAPAAAPPADPLQEKIKLLEQSLGAFRQAILSDSKDETAKYNYEVVQEMLRRLQQQQQQQQKDQNKKQDQQNKDQQNKDQQNKDQQNKDQQNKDQQNKDQQNKDQQNKQNQDQNKQDQNKQNQQQQNKDQQQKQNQNQQQQQKQDKGQEKKDQQARAKQDKGLEAQPTPQPSPDADPQKPDNQQAGEQQPMTPEKMNALRLLNLLENEKPEQFKNLFRFQGKAPARTPEKDW